MARLPVALQVLSVTAAGFWRRAIASHASCSTGLSPAGALWGVKSVSLRFCSTRSDAGEVLPLSKIAETESKAAQIALRSARVGLAVCGRFFMAVRCR